MTDDGGLTMSQTEPAMANDDNDQMHLAVTEFPEDEFPDPGQDPTDCGATA